MVSKLKNLQFLGVFGIIQETIKLIYQWKKIFSQITLAFILPSYVLIFSNIAISIFFLHKTKPSNNTTIFPQSPINYYLIFNIVSQLISAVFNLLATATIVYTVAYVYAGHDDVSFKQVIGIVPKVWKRILLTTLSIFIYLLGLTFVFSLVLIFLSVLFSLIGSGNGLIVIEKYFMTISVIFALIFSVGILYLILTWELSKIVAVLEEVSGFKAMARSKALVKGKMRMVIKLFVVLGLPIDVVQFVFSHWVIQSTVIGIVGKVVLLIIWMLLFALFLLITLVAHTLLYFVCKSYHHEIVDNLSLSDHLQWYLATDYDPVKVDDEVCSEKLQIV